MAEGLMERELEKLGKNGIMVRSAGIRAIDGFSPTEETIEVMKENGMDVHLSRSQSLDEDLVNGSDLILVMENVHKNDIRARFPYASAKTHLLKEYKSDVVPTDSADAGIQDPIGMPLNYYRNCFKAIKAQIERIAATI